MFGVDFVESHTAEAGTDGRVQICCNALLWFEISRRNGVCADGPSGGIGSIGVGHRNSGACANGASGQDVLGSYFPIIVQSHEVKHAKGVDSGKFHLGDVVETF